jgi:hypothetical protein
LKEICGIPILIAVLFGVIFAVASVGVPLVYVYYIAPLIKPSDYSREVPMAAGFFCALLIYIMIFYRIVRDGKKRWKKDSQ